MRHIYRQMSNDVLMLCIQMLYCLHLFRAFNKRGSRVKTTHNGSRAKCKAIKKPVLGTWLLGFTVWQLNDAAWHRASH